MEKPDLRQFPESPGVYLYKDDDGRIIYVGKARRLRRRIASYFRNDAAISAKTRVMLQHAATIDILLTDTEKEALLLEAGLIKKHRPRYNIVLRDDKEYLLFAVNMAHPFPRVEVVRKSPRSAEKKTTVRTFGPFSSGNAARETWKLIHKHFPLRRCRDRAFLNRTRPCLYHDMGACLGPCVLPVPKETYRALLDKVFLLLSGRSSELAEHLKRDMLAASEALHFEEAARLRDQLKAVAQTLERQNVVLAPGTNLDVAGLAQVNEGLALGLLFVRDGRLLDGRSFFWPGLTMEDSPELISGFISQYYFNRREFAESIPPRIVAPWLPKPGTQEYEVFSDLETALTEMRGGPVRISGPLAPEEDGLTLMAAENAREYASRKAKPDLAEALGKALHAPGPVRRVEVVDISHTGGTNTRAGLVVYENGEPAPSDFRAYSLDEHMAAENAQAGDDYAALAAFAARRAASGPPWPDLLLVDGGRGQLAAVHRVFSEAGLSPFLASIAKARTEDGRADRRAGNTADRIFLPGRVNPLPLAPGSAELLFLQRVRDAAHDYVIGRHRKARAAAALSGELTRIPGVGPHLAKILFDRFGSLAAMHEAGVQALRSVPGVGEAKAALISKRLAVLLGKKA